MVNLGLKVPIEQSVLDVYNEFGCIRKGDLVALCQFIEAIRKQYNPKFKVYLSPHHCLGGYLLPFKDYLATEASYKTVPYRGNLWFYSDYLYKRFNITPLIRNPHHQRDGKVVIAPVFDAQYNEDRNWSFRLAERILDWCLEHNYHTRIIGTASVRQILNQSKYSDDLFILDDVKQSIAEVRSCEYFIGGDSGFTHFAGAIDGAANSILALYGNLTTNRHQAITYQMREYFLKYYLEDANKLFDITCNYFPKPHHEKRCMIQLLDRNRNFNKIEQLLEETIGGRK